MAKDSFELYGGSYEDTTVLGLWRKAHSGDPHFSELDIIFYHGKEDMFFYSNSRGPQSIDRRDRRIGQIISDGFPFIPIVENGNGFSFFTREMLVEAQSQTSVVSEDGATRTIEEKIEGITPERVPNSTRAIKRSRGFCASYDLVTEVAMAKLRESLVQEDIESPQQRQLLARLFSKVDHHQLPFHLGDRSGSQKEGERYIAGIGTAKEVSNLQSNWFGELLNLYDSLFANIARLPELIRRSTAEEVQVKKYLRSLAGSNVRDIREYEARELLLKDDLIDPDLVAAAEKVLVAKASRGIFRGLSLEQEVRSMRKVYDKLVKKFNLQEVHS